MREGCTKTERPASVSSLFPEPQECNNAGYYFPFVRQPVTYSIEKMLFLPSFLPRIPRNIRPGKRRRGKGVGFEIIFHVGRCEINNGQTRFDFPEVPVDPPTQPHYIVLEGKRETPDAAFERARAWKRVVVVVVVGDG